MAILVTFLSPWFAAWLRPGSKHPAAAVIERRMNLRRSIDCSVRSLAHTNGCFYRHAWPEIMLRILALIDVDTNWKALHDLYVVAACIFRRKETEEGS